MGKASSAKKVARAARAGKTRRSSSRSWTFPAAVALIVVLGVGLVLVARAGQDEAVASPPRIGLDHWHAAYGIYQCDTFLPPSTDQTDPLGIHTHGDGVIHIHPTSSRAAGSDATLGVFADAIGMELSDDEVDAPEATLSESEGCGDEPAELRVVRWNADDPEDEGTEFTTDFGDVRFTRDRQAITIALVPEGAEVPRPESVPQLDQLSDVPSASTLPPTLPSITQPPDATGTTGTLGDATSTTAAGDGSTSTTAADDGSTTTAGGDGTTSSSSP